MKNVNIGLTYIDVINFGEVVKIVPFPPEKLSPSHQNDNSQLIRGDVAAALRIEEAVESQAR